MPSRDDAWRLASEFFSSQLQQRWEQITVGGETIMDKWGVTLETCQRYRVGFAPADQLLYDHLRQHGVDAQAIAAGNGFGLITRGHNVFNGRIVFPYIERDKILYFSGRETDATPASDFFKGHKFLHQKLETIGLEQRPLYLEPQFSSPVFIVEGMMQALRLRQDGFCAVAIGAAVPNTQQTAQLRRLPQLFLIPDVDILAPRPPSWDSGGEFRPALTAADRLTAYLSYHRALPLAKLIRYDNDFASHFPHGDMNDWFKTGSREQFLNLITAAIDLDTAEILAIDPQLPVSERSSRLQALVERIAGRSQIETDAILSLVKTHLKLSRGASTELNRQISALRATGLQTPVDAHDFSRAAEFHIIYPGADFVNNILYYTVFKRDLVTTYIKNKPHVELRVQPYCVSSASDFFPATPSELIQRKLAFPADVLPDTNASVRWSDNEQAPFGLPAFIRNPQSARPETAQLYQNIVQYYKDYLFLDNPFYYDFLGLFTMLTYGVNLFECMGFLGLNGTKGSGKSRVMEAMSLLCWNPIMASSTSPAFVYRSVDSSCPTLFIDEAENLSSMKTVNDDVNELSMLLHGGYRKSGKVGRCVGTESKPHLFRAFTCYVIANIRGFNPTLGSRMFFLTMKRCPSDVELKQWNRQELAPFSASIRDQLHCWTLHHAPRIAEIARLLDGDKSSFLKEVGLRNREREIVLPFFAYALVIDELLSGNRWNWGETPESLLHPLPGKSVCGNLLEAQSHMRAIKEEILLTQDVGPIFLAGMRQLLNHSKIPQYEFADIKGRESGWIETAEATQYLNRLQGLRYFPRKTGPNALKQVLANKFDLLETEKFSGGILDCIRAKRPGDHKRRTYVRVDPARLVRVCMTYGVPLDAEVDEDDAAAAAATTPDSAQTAEDV